MSLEGKKIAILVHNYFEQVEFEEPYNALKEAGAEVDIISTDQIALKGMNHVKIGDSFEADMLIEQASSDDYDAIVIPGGVINADNLRVNELAKDMVTDFLNDMKPVAIICHAPWLLVSADLIDGRRLTSYHTIRDDIINAGGEWVDLPVVIDANLITSRQPDDLPYFNDTLITILSRNTEMPIMADDDEDDEVEDILGSSHHKRGYHKSMRGL